MGTDSGWTHVIFSDDDAYPQGSSVFGKTIYAIEIVFDEGSEDGQSSIYLDNISVNGVTMGKPGIGR